MRLIAFLFALVSLCACTTLKVTDVDPKTGLLPGATTSNVTILVNKPFDLDKRKQLAVVTGSDFLSGQLRKINYFDSVMDREELEKAVVAANLTDQIPAVQDQIGLNRAAKHYRPFMWVHFDVRRDGSKEFIQLILTDPVTLENLFVAERHLDYLWVGVNDQTTFYPVFNALIEYISENSHVYRK